MGIAGELCSWFMWMGEIRLEDGSAVHAYKHRQTRRYFHLSESGVPFEYVSPRNLRGDDPGRYREITRVEAIEEAFRDWEQFHQGDEGFAELRVQLDDAIRIAHLGQQAPYDRTWLDRQRRFEQAVDAARNHERAHDPGFREVRYGDDGDQFYGDIEEVDGVSEGRTAA